MIRYPIPATLVAVVFLAAALPADAAKICRDRIAGDAQWAQSKATARSKARISWMDKARAAQGDNFADWRIAKRSKILCTNCKNRRESSCRGNSGHVCMAIAYPCMK